MRSVSPDSSASSISFSMLARGVEL